jgi:hypothetical protein
MAGRPRVFLYFFSARTLRSELNGTYTYKAQMSGCVSAQRDVDTLYIYLISFIPTSFPVTHS